MATLIHFVSFSMGLQLCYFEYLALLQVWLCSRTSKSLSLGGYVGAHKTLISCANMLMYKITMYSPCLLTYFHNFSVYLISGTYVLNWSISRNYKEIWNSNKIGVTAGMYLTQAGSVQRSLTSGPRG
jgi:hypothetical protein